MRKFRYMEDIVRYFSKEKINNKSIISQAGFNSRPRNPNALSKAEGYQRSFIISSNLSSLEVLFLVCFLQITHL